MEEVLREKLRRLASLSMEEGIPIIGEQTGMMLRLLAMILSWGDSKANVIESGTGLGYSTMWLASGLHDSGSSGKVYTVDHDEGRLNKARNEFRSTPYSDYVEFILGDEVEVFRGIRGKFRLVFLDGAKQDYLPCLNAVIGKMERPAIVAAHNVFSHKSELYDYIMHVKSKKGWDTLLLATDPAGLGITFIR